jgi:hypothetical protein
VATFAARQKIIIVKTMVEELLARTRLEMSQIVAALDAVRSILTKVETADATRDTAAAMISLISPPMVRLRNELDLRRAPDDASNIVQFERPAVVSPIAQTPDIRNYLHAIRRSVQGGLILKLIGEARAMR